MSYGGALGLKAKLGLARGASLAGTATNSGEAPLVPEERREAKYFIGQYNRGGWMNDPESLRQLDAIEIQLGQGAQAAAPMGSSSWQLDEPFRKRFGIRDGEGAPIHTRLEGVDHPSDFPPLVRSLRETYGVPVGLKTCASHYLEQEIDIALDGGIDYIVVDGAEAGTHGGPTILQDNVGLPTIVRPEQDDSSPGETRGETGGFRHRRWRPDHAGSFSQSDGPGSGCSLYRVDRIGRECSTPSSIWLLPEPPVQVLLYEGKFKEDFNVEQA